MNQTEVATKVAIRHCDKIVVTENPRTHGDEELMLTVAAVRKEGVLFVLVDGERIPTKQTCKPVEEVANELFHRFAEERGFKLP